MVLMLNQDVSFYIRYSHCIYVI